MQDKKVADLIKRASEAAKAAPEHLQAAAFNAAFNAYMVQEDGAAKRGPRNNSDASRKKGSAPQSAGSLQTTMSSLDRTAHPDINGDVRIYDCCLRVLRAAKDDCGVDGLTCSEMVRILKDKFRVPTTRQAVHQALDKAGRHVDRRQTGKSVTYHLMNPGEKYLEDLTTSEPTASTSTPKRRAQSKVTKSPATPKTKEKTFSKPAKASRQSGNVASKNGPTGFVSKMLETGFFEKGRTISDISQHLKEKYGRTFAASELSPLLLRLLRNENLGRAKNGEGQYEYKRP